MCEVLLDPANGMVMLTGRDPGSMALYSCEMGFMLEGTMTRTCQSDGSWSGTEPTCVCKCIFHKMSKHNNVHLIKQFEKYFMTPVLDRCH